MAMGYFNDQEKEYVITDMYPKRNLLNYLWNDTTVCACDQFGFGTSWSVINGVRRSIENGVRNLTIHNGERIIYIKDLDEGEYFSPNRNYKKQKFDAFECHVGLGYQKVVSEYKGIRVEFTTLVPSIGHQILFSVKVANISQRKKNLKLYFYMSPNVESGGHEAYTSAEFNREINGIFYDVEGYKLPNEYVKSYVATDKPVQSFAVTPADFKGLYNSFEDPEGLSQKELCSKGSVFEESYAGAFSYDVKLSVGETYETIVVCGFGRNFEECLTAVKRFANVNTFAEELRLQR
jgi:cellobiose phosphorylase